jgi:hypothetical protein
VRDLLDFTSGTFTGRSVKDHIVSVSLLSLLEMLDVLIVVDFALASKVYCWFYLPLG